MKSRWIAFRLLPASWGLKGDAYAVAHAHYYYEGEELERRLVEIACRNDPDTLSRRMLDLDFRFNHLNAYQYDTRIAEQEINDPYSLTVRKLEIDLAHAKIAPYAAAREKVLLRPDGVEREVALLEVERQFDRLSKVEFEKQRATLNNEPWIAIINSGFDPEQGIDGVFFEFDWNSKWIDFLRLNGYVGHTDEQIVDDWFTEVCRSQTGAETLRHHLHAPGAQ